MTTYEEHQAFADTLEKICVAEYGTEYKWWPSQDFQAYAEHLMLGMDAMTDEEVQRRFYGEPDPRAARDESRAYWIKLVTGELRLPMSFDPK